MCIRDRKLEAETKSLTYKMNGIPFLANANISAKMDVDADLANNKYTLKDNTIPVSYTHLPLNCRSIPKESVLARL